MVYAGIGSRQTPESVLGLFSRLAACLSSAGHVLRSGGAPGADSAFEMGAGDLCEIFLPWSGFNGSSRPFTPVSAAAFEIAQKFHPAWAGLSSGAKKLHARNSCQVLGHDLRSPVDFVICYTVGGRGGGGTGQALRIARAYGVPVFDVGGYSDVASVRVALMAFLKKMGAVA